MELQEVGLGALGSLACGGHRAAIAREGAGAVAQAAVEAHPSQPRVQALGRKLVDAMKEEEAAEQQRPRRMRLARSS